MLVVDLYQSLLNFLNRPDRVFGNNRIPISCAPPQRRQISLSSDISKRYADVAEESLPACPPDGRALKQLFEPFIVERKVLVKRRQRRRTNRKIRIV